MQFNFPYKNQKPRELIRSCGYSEWSDPHSDQISWTRPLGLSRYPHFHVYIEEKSDHFVFNLHLDQKAPSYQAGRAHSGEYDGSIIEGEAQRITAVIAGLYGVAI